MNSEIFNESIINYEISPLFPIFSEKNLNINSFSDISFYRKDDLGKDNSFHSFLNIPEKPEKEEFLEDIFKKEIEKIEQRIKEEEKNLLNFNIFNNLNFQDMPLPEPLCYDQSTEKKKIKIETDRTLDKSTDYNTKDTKEKINKCIFGLKGQIKIEPRIDYCIKQIKVFISKFLKEYGNQLIKECKFQNEMKKLKLFSPSYKYFTGNSNDKDNKIFLNFTVEQIFSYPDNKSKKDNRLQKKNKDIIKNFLNYIENKYGKEIPENMEKLKNFFKMTFEDIITLFYNSKQFKDYSSEPKTIFLDKQFIKAKGFSLLEKNAFIKLIKNYNVRTE